MTTVAPPPARFRPIADVAYALERPPRTIRNWARDGLIPRREYRGTVLVDLVAAHKLSAQAGRRTRKPAAA
ncbi:MAG TPA: hypothetical protein VIQ30_08330 [Pseudonocardia sp.]